ncbi:hypothetical protein HELRODRAFT_104662 [Helobdella robusta]|uniref:SKI-interacting protein SKIP SNW domain-containing protein n=1 Tax=Helobdella robusta TaxID=6412 RepID=T1EDM8_HELRO|nr:hypothetical protein HELRODRAFT_104662 [Helobdella robusta]ESO11373.1 hypothetical protein HELRODRAFT_104662 [Helobdella robusta]
MESLTNVLPPPVYQAVDRQQHVPSKITSSVVAVIGVCPPYGQRKGWIPRKVEDYGDGGAFPEIHTPQFPLGMGSKKSTSNALAKTVDSEGNVRYDAIARVGHRQDKIVHSRFNDLTTKVLDPDDSTIQKPDPDYVKEITDKTKDALEKLVAAKISAAMPVRAAEKKGQAQYIRYTPSQQGVAFNSGAKQSVIRMIDVQQDPMEPPKFRTNKKIPRGPPSPPAPVLHSPNRKVTVKEQQEWKIPPCVSNWKNAKGYTIPLDKRLAADGRGLQATHMNENFSKLAEALYLADRKARENVEARAQMEKKAAQKEKMAKEERLKMLAHLAREQRAGVGTNHDASAPANDVDDPDFQTRSDLRRDLAKERQRDRNISRAAPDKRNRLQKERERDISEKIALGMPNPGNRGNDDAMFDQRLFNQSKGLDSGFGGGEDDRYDVYDKPWRSDKDFASHIYRPSKNVSNDNLVDDIDNLIKSNRFVADKPFSGSDATIRRDGPVQFEKEEEEDPFGLNKFLDEAKRGQKRNPNEGNEHSSSKHGHHHSDHSSNKRRKV